MNGQFRAIKHKRISTDIKSCFGGESWSAASEGVPAALRLSKSAQSADKVHFSDSSGEVLDEPDPLNLHARTIG
jgi:hypothetical protein